MSNTALWNDLVENTEASRQKFNQSFKCLNKAVAPKHNTQIKHFKVLVAEHNNIAVEIAKAYNFLNSEQKVTIANFFQTIKTRLSVIFKRLNAQCTIPDNLTDLIVANFSEVTDESSDSEDSEMAPMTPSEFINTAAKLIPDFDGKFENLQRFLDALTLLDSIKESNESIAITLIKTKLIGTARNLISTETTIQAIKETLTSKVKGHSTQAVTAKLLNTRQNSKSPNDFAKDIEEATKLLQNAYISEGLSPELAENYSTQTAVKAVIKNATSDKIKIIMQAGQFSSLNQVITKFIESSSNINETPRVNYMQKILTDPTTEAEAIMATEATEAEEIIKEIIIKATMGQVKTIVPPIEDDPTIEMLDRLIHTRKTKQLPRQPIWGTCKTCKTMR